MYAAEIEIISMHANDWVSKKQKMVLQHHMTLFWDFHFVFLSYTRTGRVHAHAWTHRPLKWPSVTTWPIPPVWSLCPFGYRTDTGRLPRALSVLPWWWPACVLDWCTVIAVPWLCFLYALISPSPRFRPARSEPICAPILGHRAVTSQANASSSASVNVIAR